MATINQLQNQLNTAEKRLYTLNERLKMYSNRADKNLKHVQKILGNNTISFDNFRDVLKDNWELYYSISSNLEEVENKKKQILFENKVIESLKLKIDNLQKIAQTNDNEIYSLQSSLEKSMSEFKLLWFNKMNDWYNNHYDFIHENLKKGEKNYLRAEKIQNYIKRQKYWIDNHSRMFSFVRKIILNYRTLSADNAALLDKSSYLKKVNSDLINTWNRGMLKLANKCLKFSVNEKEIKISNPSITDKGFSVILTDNRDRIIDARVIFAAEFSHLVAPHTRYIVTEREYGRNNNK